MDLFLSKIKQLLLSGLVKSLKFLGSFKIVFKVIFKFFSLPIYYFYRGLLFILLPLYNLLRKSKKKALILPEIIKERLVNLLLTSGPLIVVVVIGLVIFATNLKAEGVKPEDYGKDSMLYKIAQSGEAFSLTYDKDALVEEEELIEGPLDKQSTPTSYLKHEAITSEEAELQQSEEGIDTLISVTGDDSALISPEITDPEVVVKQRDKIIDYQVQFGDTLSSIAKKFNLQLTTILWENSLTYYSLIKPGQILRILPVNGLSYAIQSKDSLDKIAKKYKITVDEIVEFNKLASAEDIQIGQKIILPGAAKQEVYTASSSYSIKNILYPTAEVSKSKLQWPTNAFRITQYYSWRHHGIDIGNKKGTPIYAAEDGVVELAEWNRGGYGYMVVINHGGGLKTLYAHCSFFNVKAGDKVQRGQVIANVGSTGRSTGPHLHFEVRVNNNRVNPLGYVR